MRLGGEGAGEAISWCKWRADKESWRRLNASFGGGANLMWVPESRPQPDVAFKLTSNKGIICKGQFTWGSNSQIKPTMLT
jgi:hypothetical protein